MHIYVFMYNNTLQVHNFVLPGLHFMMSVPNFYMLYSLLHLGGTCEAWLGGVKGLLSVDRTHDVERSSSGTKDRGRFGADLFGSVCYTFQHGKFRNTFGDLTRIDARLDIVSASALAKKVSSLVRSAQSNQPPNELSSPRLNLIFQQQVNYMFSKLFYLPICFLLNLI